MKRFPSRRPVRFESSLRRAWQQSDELTCFPRTNERLKIVKLLFWIICSAALWLALTTPLASAQEDDHMTRAQPLQEVFQTGLVYTQERGEVQLSYTSRFSRGKDLSSLQTPLNLEYGITDRW